MRAKGKAALAAGAANGKSVASGPPSAVGLAGADAGAVIEIVARLAVLQRFGMAVKESEITTLHARLPITHTTAIGWGYRLVAR